MSTQPIFIDVGKKSRKQVRQLKKGKGKLLRVVTRELEAQLGGIDGASKKTIVPVILLYRRKPKSARPPPMRLFS